MKLLPLISSLLAVAAAAPLAEEAAPQDVENVEAEKPGRSPLDSTQNGVKVLPRFSQTEPKDGAKRTTVKYGTWSVTSTKMLQTTKLAKGPCVGVGCYVTAMEATIRYPDGKEANVDTGAWLHHIALFGSGGGQGSLWAAGNERPTLRLNSEAKYGLDFPSAFMLMVDLMTEDVKPKSLTLEITYEHVPKIGSGYKAAAMYWLSIGEPAAKDGVYSFKSMPSISGYNAKLLYAIGHMHDGGTNMNLYVNSKLACKSVMHYNMRAGYGLGGKGAKAGGGMEGMDMGEEAPKKAAKGKTTKAAKAAGDDMEGMDMGDEAPKKAAKGKTAKAATSTSGHSHSRTRRDGHGGHGGHGDDGMEHISDPGACTDFGTVSRGDKLYGEAWYDAIKHPLMVHNGKKENLMGNMRVYIGPN